MLQTFKCKRHRSGCGVAMGCYGRSIVPRGAIVTSQFYDRYCSTEYPRTLMGYLLTPWQREFRAITGCQSIDNLLDFNAICCIFISNDSLDATVGWRQSFWYSKNARAFGPRSTFRACGTAKARTRRGKQLFVNSFHLLFQSTILVVLTYMFVLNKRNTLWLRDTVRQTSLGNSAGDPAATDFPCDVCLTVSRNHKVFLLYHG